MKRRYTVPLSLFCALVFMLTGVAPGYAAKLKAEYKMSVNISEVTPQGKAAAWFVNEVKARTDGKVNIKIYWNGQLFSGKATNELLLMRKGVGDFSLSSFINWAPQFPDGNLFLLPWFISSKPDRYKALDAIEAGRAGKMLEAKIDSFNLKVLAWGEQGARELTNNIRPVRSPEDIKNLKIRVVGSPLFLDIFHALGANPMNISWGEALTALQQNTVDGQENPYSVYMPNKIYEFQKYMTEWSYNMDPLIYVVHKKAWDSFPADVQQIIKECAEKAGMYNKCLARLGLDDGASEKWLTENELMPPVEDTASRDPRGFVISRGVQVTLLTPEEIARFAELTKPVLEKWVERVGKDLVDAAEEDMRSAQY